MKKRIILPPIFILIAAIVSFASVSEQANANTKKARPERTLPVVVGTVEEHQLVQSLTLIGKLDAKQAVYIAPQISGKISQIHVKANQHVKAGEVLVTLDDAKAKANFVEASAFYNNEKRKLAEYQTLLKHNAMTQTEIDAQQSNVDIAAAKLAAAKVELSYHSLTAPFDGTAGMIDFSQGKIVNSGAELLSLDDLSSMYLDLQVPERYLSMLKTGMQVNATSQAWGKTSFTGYIQAIDSRVDQDTLNLKVRVEFPNQSQQLKPGMLLSAKMLFPAISEPVIPVQAIEYSGTKRFVYVVGRDNQANRTEVHLGERIDNEVMITDGLEIGEHIVVQGLVNMRDGIKVNIVSANEIANAPSKAANNKPKKERG